MIKYVIAFTVFTIFAMENVITRNKICAQSLPNRENIIPHFEQQLKNVYSLRNYKQLSNLLVVHLKVHKKKASQNFQDYKLHHSTLPWISLSKKKIDFSAEDGNKNAFRNDPLFIEKQNSVPKSFQSQAIDMLELPPAETSMSDEGNDIKQSNIHLSHHCFKCESQRHVEHITQEELTQLRVEFVKAQILEKLRLKERPKILKMPLPKPIQDGVKIYTSDEKFKNRELDDYYARTNKKFIFLERETRECERTNLARSICFSFNIDEADADGLDVNTAALWIYMRKGNNTQINKYNTSLKNQEDIVVYEVQQPDDKEFLPVSKPIAIKRVDESVSDNWLEIHIEWPIQRWFGNHDLSHLIQISCESCDINNIEDIIFIEKEYFPFIMIDTQNRRQVTRPKRNINCIDGISECCREKLYISFKEIGWGDWIVQPRGYDAYFCRGTCSTVASITQSASHHNTFLQKVIADRRGTNNKALEIIPCCTAKQYSSLQLVFMDSNNTATQKTFPNMVVESCGCR